MAFAQDLQSLPTQDEPSCSVFASCLVVKIPLSSLRLDGDRYTTGNIVFRATGKEEIQHVVFLAPGLAPIVRDLNRIYEMQAGESLDLGTFALC